MTITDSDGNMFTDLDDPAWLALFNDVGQSWFRLETLQTYAVDYEQHEFEQFQATGRLDRPWGAWQQMIRRHTEARRHLQRVHIVAEPLTDYLRYEFAAYRQNVEAGEDVRLLPVRAGDWPPDLPQGDDFWLFDNREVWDMHYDTDGRFIRAALNTSADRLQQCQAWRNAAAAQAVTLADYLLAA